MISSRGHVSLDTQRKNAAAPVFTAMRGRILQRKCACGRTPGSSGECEACRKKKLQRRPGNLPVQSSVNDPPSSVSEYPPIVHEVLHEPREPLGAHTRAFMEPRFGHSFARVRVKTEQERPQSNNTPAQSITTDVSDAAELPLSGEMEPGVDLAQEPAPTAAPTEAPPDVAETPKSCCLMESFGSSNDSYVDTDTDTRKNIKFTSKVKSGSDEKKCVMVNWIQGTAKNKDGTFRSVKMFDKTVDYNFPTTRIDSLDKDPVYWSDSSARWHYQPAGADSFYATDSPGPQVWVDGIDYDLKFKMCLYCIDDVSATSDETGSGVKNPLKCIDWMFKAKYDAAAKKFTH
jgi:hypothetical protein